MTTCEFCQTPYVHSDRVRADIPNCACLRDRLEAENRARREADWTARALQQVERLRLGTLNEHDRKPPTVKGWEDPRAAVQAKSNLLVTGPVGTAKTTLLKQIAYSLALAGYKVRGGSVARILSELKTPENIKPMMDSFSRGHVLFLDDLDKLLGTSYELERLYLIIDDYWSNGRSIVSSMNGTLDELENRMTRREGDSRKNDAAAIIDRLLARVTLVTLDGPSFRSRTGA